MPAPLSQRLRKDTQFEINGEDDTGTPEKLTTPSYPVATRERALGESTTPLDHNAIQERALGVLSLMDSMPCTWVGTKTYRATQERDYKRTPQPTPTQASIENTVCAVCNKTDLGLLFCDRCIETTSLYHPHCLLVLPDTNECICDMCNGTQTSQTNPPHDPTQKKKLDSTAIDKHHGKIPDKDLSDNKLRHPHPRRRLITTQHRRNQTQLRPLTNNKAKTQAKICWMTPHRHHHPRR